MSFDVDVNSVDIGTADAVVKVGDAIPELSGPVSSLSIYDPINTRGQIAFWATDGSTQTIVRANPVHTPVLIVPGIAGTYAADLNLDVGWLLNRGVPPEQLRIDPLGGVYDDLIKSLERAGYKSSGPKQDLFIVNYDWRLTPAPWPQSDAEIDGKVAGLDAAGISDNTFQYGVDYLGYYLRKAAATWNARFPGQQLPKVNVIAHSTGGLVARAYIQSDAYGQLTNDGVRLPEIDNFFMIGVPNRGASKAWNPLHDDWNVDISYRIVLSKILDRAFEKVLQGRRITGPDYDITIAEVVPGDAFAQEDFVRRYQDAQLALSDPDERPTGDRRCKGIPLLLRHSPGRAAAVHSTLCSHGSLFACYL